MNRPARLAPAAWLLLAGVLWLVIALVSLSTGPLRIAPRTVIDALLHHDPSVAEHVVVTTTRLSRLMIATLVGAALAVAGALMQAMTRNPLASPGLFGVNAGAVLAIVLVSLYVALSPAALITGAAFAGAALAGAAVHLLGNARHAGPTRLVLAGAAITALCVAITQAILIVDQESLDNILFWLAGSTSARDMRDVLGLVPVLILGLIGALLLAPHLDVLAAGDQVAAGLGQRMGRIKAATGLAVVCLAGAAVSMAGSIGFIGLIVPHLARRLVSPRHGWLLPACALFGAVLLVAADVLARATGSIQELPIGVLTTIVGVPVFIVMLRRGQHGRG
ncbi:iron ABC transporter permease [Pigmentiphaga aceris]|uniref:Iron ABC transporter permease n=2 Tax=Pigmentiphaga aceris TaxID=1940612 RepID=A0A5C0B3G2_9BURK|nr:iron ABC transporter permease [Pigmentiphaga aceris]